ncbi:TIGR04086 family membrane protein [Marinisporobacter balticus]|uniref:Putative membrane protein (TIGR04086 family) n=1 Tax=Marinisporobacter balticus TaxID=2018667 RepID=A0A4R2L6X1_9FIRM|nr:TIGR04086 family membrane protein [Marinisporobacter balticus]TCO79849.1 putative membrane protein (TIGR04086 family) [Marinisporobacter balticus]
MKAKNNIETGRGSVVGVYVKAILFACIVALFILIIVALLITYTNISESIIPIVVSITMVISSLTCGMVTGSKMKKKGWFNGALVGLIYVMLIIFMSWVLIADFTIGRTVLVKSIIGIVSGGVGGMIGVNLK